MSTPDSLSTPDSANGVSLIVGIGASAGGLDAFSELLSHLPIDTGMGFVLVQHLAPGQESLLSELLARVTPMPVVTVTDGMVVEANSVYVIPPNARMTIAGGQLQLATCDQSYGRVKTIDLFLQSLAADQKNKAIAIVLSGSNNDGTIGVRAIRAEGGIVFAQDRATAEFADMPAAAIETGSVDFVLSPAAIAEELVKLKRHPYLRTTTVSESEVSEAGEGEVLTIQEDELAQVFRLLQRQTGVDFGNYKPTTFQRRLRRRMALQKCLNLSDYTRYLQEHPSEIQALYQDVLITVTGFFRDADMYAVLQAQVFPLLLQQPNATSNIRIWVPGCATGEEAYSLAMCLMECLHSLLITPTLQIFGTDISDESIEVARTGFYREAQMEQVSADRRLRFFTEVDGGYQIKKSVRELCIFARQDLSSDPPFSEIDLLSCRNVLIYFKPSLQKRVLSFFHYSLKPSGFLILGNSESLGDTTDMFEIFDSQGKIYTRRSVPSRLNFDFIASYYPRETELEQRQGFSATLNRTNLQQWADQIVLSRFGPAGVIVNEQLEILQFRGDTSPYLRIPAGEPSYNLLKMIRPSLLIDLRMVIEEAKQQGNAIRRQGLEMQDLSEFSEAELTVEVIPFHTSTSPERCYLILFERETAEPLSVLPSSDEEPEAEAVEIDPEIRRLRQELASSRQELLDTQTLLQLTIEEKESTNQQLIAANEEILSSNEELKSTNEELQTAKEEIQSANEELKTTNEELQNRNLEARRANDDLVNLINNVNIPILMLSSDLCIRRFTPSAQRMFNLIPTDVGRPISDLRFRIIDSDLETLVTDVIANLNPVEREVQDQQGYWYILRIRPYRTIDNQIMGAIVALVDINNLKQTEQSLRQTQGELEIELDAMKQVQDLSLQLFSSLDLNLVLHQVLDAVMNLLHANLGNIQLYDPQREVLEIFAHQGFDAEFLNHFREVRIDDGSACSRALKSKQRVIIEDTQTDSEFAPHYQIAAAAGFRAVQSTPLLSRQGEILGVLSTHFRQPHRPSERELRMLDLYGRMVSEMIALVQTQQDREVQIDRARVAEAANTSKDEFLAMLSHELRTPLTSIRAWIQLMAQGLLDEAQTQQAIAVIQESALTQTKLIEDLLDVSRMVQQRFEIDPVPCDLMALLQQAIAQLHPQIQQKGLQLETDLQPFPARLSCDPMRILQAVANLLVNAIKFTPTGGSIILRAIEMPTQVQIQVSDTGIGIDSDELPYIFERFRQADSSITRRAGGLGLGLFVVRSIVEAHGGTVVADSPGLNQGATFTLTLPKQEVVSAAPSPTVAMTAVSLNGLCILLVEDDPSVSMVIAFALEQHGAIVTITESAAEALTNLAQEPPNLIISDIGLPDVNGYDLMRQIRALPPEQGGELPAIALSGYADPLSVNTALEEGFQAYLSKPVDLDELMVYVSNLIQREPLL
ncbi:MAG: chemotaxis protein CheB [Synechococcales bacterium]|nr:chemotaxis protein CheB [Synechococcales bacterium]